MEDLENALGKRMRQLEADFGQSSLQVTPGKRAGYGMKLKIRDGEGTEGGAVLYFKPTRGTFTLVPDRSMPPALAEKAARLWESGESLPGVHIYVDGSCLDDRVGYGMVALRDGQVIQEYYGPVTRSTLVSSRQVGGEITAVVRALDWCRRQGIREVTIHYDLEHLGKWARGEYKARVPMAAGYKRYIDDSGIRIHWAKTAAHSGDRYNDRADALARKGAAGP